MLGDNERFVAVSHASVRKKKHCYDSATLSATKQQIRSDCTSIVMLAPPDVLLPKRSSLEIKTTTIESVQNELNLIQNKMQLTEMKRNEAIIR